MKSDVIILGAGIGGLTCAYQLLLSGKKVVLFEKESEVGGLLRPVIYKDFTLDYGYKNLDDCIPEVHHFWKELLGDDYLPIDLRAGVLYHGHILEHDKTYKGLFRGIPPGILFQSVLDLVKSKMVSSNGKYTSLASFMHYRRGEKFTRIFTQNYSERSRGCNWNQIPSPAKKEKVRSFSGFVSDASKVVSKRGRSFHPSKGIGQIISALKRKIEELGGKIYLETQVSSVIKEKNHVKGLRVTIEGKETECIANHFVSSLPIPIVNQLFQFQLEPKKSELSFKRGTIMVYLLLDSPVKFPHSYLRVSCPKTTFSRVTNYAKFGDQMVPAGKGCLCFEFFIPHAKHIIAWGDKQIENLTITEAQSANLIDKEILLDSLVIRDLHADAAQSWKDYESDKTRKEAFEKISTFENLYQINRTGADKSTYAGLMAAESIINGNKSNFSKLTKPDVDYSWKDLG